MNARTRRHHGLKAAYQLVLLVDSWIQDGKVELRDVAIDFEGGATAHFTAEKYVKLAKQGIEAAIAANGGRLKK